MDFQEVVRRRRMVRNFEARALPPQVVDRLLANAVRAPSAGFTQGSRFLALEGAEQTERFWASSFLPGERQRFRWQGLFRAPLIVVVLSHRQAYVDRYAEPDKAASGGGGRRQWPAPYWDIDAGFAALLMLLTAVDAGLGALFFGVFRPDALRAAFGVPDAYTPIGALAVGYAAPDEPSPSLARRRRNVEEVVHRGHW